MIVQGLVGVHHDAVIGFATVGSNTFTDQGGTDSIQPLQIGFMPLHQVFGTIKASIAGGIVLTQSRHRTALQGPQDVFVILDLIVHVGLGRIPVPPGIDLVKALQTVLLRATAQAEKDQGHAGSDRQRPFGYP
jgi:hypothetical protein